MTTNPFEFLLPPSSKDGDVTAFDELYPILVEDKTVSIYISNHFDSPSEYNRLVHTIEKLDNSFSIRLYINSLGGIVDGCQFLRFALEKTQAHIHGILTGTVASAGTLLTMVCDTIEIADGTAFMIHNYSAGIEGKGLKLAI